MQKMYSTVISFDILLLLIFIIIFEKHVVIKSTPVLCNQTKSWKLGGQDIVTNSKGLVLLVVLMPMQCEHCHKQLMKFQTIMETLPEIRIVVIAPYDENSHMIERYRREFPRISIGMESLNERIWNILSGSAHDHFIYDRCGRLASLIRHPKSDTTKFEHTLWALKLAVNYAQCGWCQYDPPDLPVPQNPIITTYDASMRNGKAKKTRIKAVVYPQNDRRYRVNLDHQADIAPDHEPLSLRTDTIAPMRKDNARTSGDYILSLSAVTPPPSTTVENNQNMVISDSESQQLQISMPKKEPVPQQTEPKFEDGQRRVMIRPDNKALKANDWRISNGLTVSHQFPNQIRQDKSQQREQQQQRKKEQQYRHEQGEKQQRYRQQNERKRKEEHEYALEQSRLQQEHRQKIRQHEEEQRRIQEQRRLQEMQRKHEERHQAQQRFHQQEHERRAEEKRRLQKQKIESEFYTDVSDEEHKNLVDVEDESNWRLFNTPPDQQHFQHYTTTRRVSFDSISPAKKTSPLYDVGDEENDYDYSKIDSETTAAPIQRKQILGTESPEHSPFLFEHQVPCAAFTDKICIEQKRRMGADKMSKCCDKGIYLTDLCVPGYCTNTTIELCCMQKFLQAKYKCCMNDSKEINTPGDAFSRCCFDKFVRDDDKCCPARRAKFHWLSAHEICLPNVRVDLSDLRFSVHTASNSQYPGTGNNNQALNDVITIDLNMDKSWDHNCEQGAKVLQFPYLPFDELVDEEEKDENSEERR